MRFQYSSTMAVFLVLLLAMTVVVIEGGIRCDTTAQEREMLVEDALGSLRESEDFQVIQVRHGEKGTHAQCRTMTGAFFSFVARHLLYGKRCMKKKHERILNV